MKKLVIKTISLFLSVMMISISVTGKNMLALAEDNLINDVGIITDSSYTHNISTSNGITAVGGLAVGTSKNRLFVLKSGNSDQNTVLRYYSNAYDMDAKPTMIQFDDGILGHANGMTIDDNYLYITMWKATGDLNNTEINNSYNNSIMVISRHAIAEISKYYKDNPNESMIHVKLKNATNPRFYVKLGNTKMFIGRAFSPIRSDNMQPYTYRIASIARYSYDKTNKKLKFIIGCTDELKKNGMENVIGYKFMTFGYNDESDKKMIVSEDDDDTFYIEKNNVKYYNGNEMTNFDLSSNCTFQDIYFGYKEGLYIPVWKSTTPTTSYIFKVKLSKAQKSPIYNYKKATFHSLTILDHSSTKYNGKTITQYEVESMAFLKLNKNKEDDNQIRIALSCNRQYKDSSGTHACDSYEILAGSKRGNLLDAN